MTLRISPILAIFSLVATNAVAYEQATHTVLTKRAFDESQFRVQAGSDSLTVRLGLNGLNPTGMTEYFEFVEQISNLAAFLHSAQQYEKDMLDSFKYSRIPSTPETWLMYGAIREDDNPSEDPPTPQDVNPGLLRPLNHFYDPIFDRRLEASGLALLDGDVHKNPDWAVGSFDSFIDPNRPEPQRKNHFTVLDAREAMFRALTLLTYNGTGYPEIAAGRDIATRQQWRQAYWATTFRALGNVLHLNQDMAQPQHTRNEPHSGKPCPIGTTCLAGHTSIYEKYINARALQQTVFNSKGPFNVDVAIPIAPLPVTEYPVPAFANYSDYWSTSPGNPSRPGKGLADYSNRGFFTAGKNFDSTEYPYPSRNPADYATVSFVPTQWDGSAASDAMPAKVYFGNVQDDWQQTPAANIPLTTFSLWDQFIRSRTGAAFYSLNRLNYDAMASLLIPRAVAYSAGLINFFFRGRIDIELPDEGVFAAADHASGEGFTMVRTKIHNKTPDFFDPTGAASPQDMSGGQFFAVVRFHRDKQYSAGLETIVGTAPCTDPAAVVNAGKPEASTQCRNGVEEIIVSRPVYGVSLSSNQQKLVEFEFGDSPIPLDITDVVLQIVYRGELGSEADAVAVGTIDVSEPTYFTYHNASDYIHIGEHVYSRGEVEADVQLLAQVQPQICVDYRRSPPRLIEGCLTPFALDLAVSFGDVANPIAAVTGLPNHRFIRLAYLTVSDEGFNPPVKSAARTSTMSVTARSHLHDGKALLNQDGTCLPHDPFNIPPRHAQMWVVPPSQLFYRLGLFGTLRGVNGWYSASCVVNGDDSPPGAPDDRAAVMTPLTRMTEEVVPYALKIMPDYLQ